MSEFSPYQSPQSDAHSTPHGPPNRPLTRPSVLTWYAVYCYLMVLLYVVVVGIGVVFVVFADRIADSDPEMQDPTFSIVMGVMFIGISLPLMLLFGSGPLLPTKKWAWIYGFVPICIGMTSLCTLPFSVALLIFWIKPETKAWYGVR